MFVSYSDCLTGSTSCQYHFAAIKDLVKKLTILNISEAASICLKPSRERENGILKAFSGVIKKHLNVVNCFIQ